MPALNELHVPELICRIFNCIQLFAQQPNLSNIYCSLYLAPCLYHTCSFHCYVCFSGNKVKKKKKSSFFFFLVQIQRKRSLIMKTVLKTAHFAQGFLLSPLPWAGGQRQPGLSPSLAHPGPKPTGFHWSTRAGWGCAGPLAELLRVKLHQKWVWSDWFLTICFL